MGAVIGPMDFNSRISPVNPMPEPDNNLLVAVQSFAAGTKTDTGLKTLMRSGGKLKFSYSTLAGQKKYSRMCLPNLWLASTFLIFRDLGVFPFIFIEFALF